MAKGAREAKTTTGGATVNEDLPQSVDELSMAFEGYLERLEAGKTPDIEAFLDQYPDIRNDLADCLEGFELVQAFSHDVGSPAPQGTGLINQSSFVLGDYRILREIGRGGMGVVYEAEQISLDRRVAVKVLPFAAFLSDRQRRRFKHEALAAASLKHPSIVDVYAVGCERSVHFYVMELVEGEDLASIISGIGQDGGLTTGDSRQGSLISTCRQAHDLTTLDPDAPEFFRNVARIGNQAAAALHFAHREGIVHRDVKPANILLDRNGAVRITDFGLATMESSEGLTRTGETAGTLRYMSPEQVAGDSAVDQRTDVYSLGLTLYELVARRPAFEQDTRPELIRAKREGRPISLDKLVPGVPRDLRLIIEKAIEHDPLDRYNGADQLATDLDNYLSHRPLLARPSSFSSRLFRLARRHPIAASSIFGTTIVLLVVAVGATIAAQKYRSLAAAQVELSQEQTELLYVQSIRLASEAIEECRWIDAEHELLQLVPSGNASDLRGFEWSYLVNLLRARAGDQSICFNTLVSDVAFSPKGERIACAIGSGKVPVWRREPQLHRQPKSLLDLKSVDAHFAKTWRGQPAAGTERPTEVLIAGDKIGKVYAWDWRTLQPVFDPLRVDDSSTSERQVCSVDVHPTKPWIAAGTRHLNGTGRLAVWDYRERQPLLVRDNPKGAVFTAFVDDDSLFVGREDASDAQLLKVPSGDLIRKLELPGAATIAALSREHRIAAVGLRRDSLSSDHWIEVRSLDDWSRKLVEFHLSDAPRSLEISPSGRFVAAGDRKGQVYLADLITSEVARERRHHGLVTSVRFSPDESLFSSTGSDNLLQFSRTEEVGLPRDGLIRCAGITPSFATGAVFLDDHRVCISRDGQHLDIWDAKSGKKSNTRPRDPGFGNWIRLQSHPEKKLLVAVQQQWPPDETETVPGRITVINRESRKVVFQHTFEQGLFTSNLPLSKDGRYLAVCAGDTVHCIDLEKGSIQSAKPFDTTWSFACAFLPDNQTLVCAAEGFAFFDVRNLTETRPRVLKGHPHVLSLQMLPDEKRIAVVGKSKKLQLIDLDSWNVVRESRAFPSPTATAIISPDGSRIAVGTQGGKVRLFLTSNCEELLDFDVPICTPFGRFSPDGNSLVIAALKDAFVVNGDSRSVDSLTRDQLRDSLTKNRVSYP